MKRNRVRLSPDPVKYMSDTATPLLTRRLAFARGADRRVGRVHADTALRTGELRVVVRRRPRTRIGGDRRRRHARRLLEAQVREVGRVLRGIREEALFRADQVT